MRFLYVDRGRFDGERIELDPEQSRRLRKVLRFRPGDELVVRFRDDGTACRVLVENLDRAGGGLVVVAGEEDDPGLRTPRPPCGGLVLAVGLLKNRKLELVVQKATELAAERIVPLLCERSVDRRLSDNERRRLLQTAEEACQQCGRPLPPLIDSPMRPVEFARKRLLEGGRVFLMHEAPEAPLLKRGELSASPLAGGNVKSAAVMVGPEGGFSSAELDECTGAGVVIRRLPGYILRAETAAVTMAVLCSPWW